MTLEEKWPPVLTKKDFVSRFVNKEFGNKGPNWSSIEEWKANPGLGKLLHIRNRIAGGSTFYNIPYQELEAKWIEVASLCGESNLYLAEMAPHHLNLIQGEVMQSEQGLQLFYSCQVGLPMRDALAKDGKQVCGIVVVQILKHFMCPNSWEWLNVLLDRYKFHVVEFSTFSQEWGTIPGYNTVFWEVRGEY